LKVKNAPYKGYRRGDSFLKSTLLYKGFRKDERGSSKYGVDFDDREYLQDKKVRIASIKVWHDGSKVVGIQAEYRSVDGSIVKGGQHLSKNIESQNPAEFNLEKDDYVKEISGFLDKKEETIECLILRSFTGMSLRIGQPKNNSKLFKLDINELEYPSILFGNMRGKC